MYIGKYMKNLVPKKDSYSLFMDDSKNKEENG